MLNGGDKPGEPIGVMAGMPTLADVAVNPALARGLTASERSRLIIQCASVLAALGAPIAEPAESEQDDNRLETQLLTVPEAAKSLRLRPAHVYALIRRGELAAVRQGRFRRVSREAIAEYVRAHEGTRPLDPSLSTMLSRMHDGKAAEARPRGART